MKITVFIADDERLARDLIKNLLAGYNELEVIGEAADGFETVKLVQELKPQLLFLDIQMPKLTGFEVLELLEHKPYIIFSTAYDNYALEAFKVNALDYLLKPYSDERFNEAVNRVKQAIAAGTKSNVADTGITLPETALERIAVKENSRIYILPAQEISRIEAMDDYIVIFHNGKKYYKKQTLKQAEAMLSQEKFVRIHRSHLVNLDFVKKLEPMEKEGWILLLSDGAEVSVSKSGYAKLKEKLRIA